MLRHLSEILKDNFGISEEDISEVQKIKKEKGGAFGEILIRKNLITEAQLLEALSIQYDIPFQPELRLDNFKSDFTRHVPIQFLKKYTMVPLERSNHTPDSENKLDQQDHPNTKEDFHAPDCIIAINNPASFQPLDDLIRILGLEDFKVVLSTKNAILSVINISYDLSQDSAEQLVQDMEENSATIISEIEDRADLLDDTSDAPIIKLVNHIISQSVKARSSDIHIEPYQDSFKVRYRVDGILYDLLTPPKWIQPALISRIKVMAKMNIAEKRLPQDGRLDVKIGDQEIDVRISTIPTSFGERVVMRLLNKSGSFLRLPDIGLEPERLDLLKNLVKSPNGIILITGPTGSGKTTTLYAILSSINKPEINIITIEDPVEYRLKGISQIQVNPKIDLTFARGLRSIVRQDPDIILIGEVRDKETAEIAVQSALTGHLVFSTLHTNDSASAITRLVDIGIEPFLISSSVIAVAAQRLVRVLCSHCKKPYTPDGMALKSAGITPDHVKNTTIYRASGCEKCFNTGYRGRIGIFEIMVLSGNLKNLILKTYDSNLIKKEALNHNMITLRQDGIQKVLKGISTIEEVLRVTQK
ncbi:MAG: type II secretion system ATPase GspE [Deltaproteobacteria bacterium]|jgi:general secretion pathway protein E|nr:type II secretion system ATPase GspE [Deltaproteobacteria bacterium]MDL1987560.1 type II secretion system ATPase GspE [Deltaproteobacteria bacterium]